MSLLVMIKLSRCGQQNIGGVFVLCKFSSSHGVSVDHLTHGSSSNIYDMDV